MRGYRTLFFWVSFGLFLAGCPKGKTDYSKGRKAESLQDYDAAFDFYLKALKTDPENAAYKIRLDRVRFEASQLHVKQGVKLRDAGDLEGAISQFQRAQVIDPSSPVAAQELQKTLTMLAEKNRTTDAAVPTPDDGEQLASSVPEIKPLSRAPINLKMVNDSKMVFDTIGKLAGLTVIYDPDYPARKISAELNNLTLEQALDIVALQSKAFWKPITENIIMVIQDQTQKRRDYEEELVRTFYLSNTVQPQDLTEIVTGLRQLLELKRIMQLNSQNAIVIRDTPDKLALAEKMIRDIDKARPEVVIQVEVLEARTDRLRDLGVLPGQHASIAVVPPGTTSGNGSGSGSGSGNGSTNSLTLGELRHLNGTDYSVTLPSFAANAVLTDTDTKIIQNPEIRSVDGQTAKLRIGDKIPIATGSFQAGVGVGTAGGAGLVNPLVNTQFQYLDVGVNVDITPRVHPNREVSMKVKVEVTSHTGDATIGGITQPIISQRVVEHDIRLREGEASILGGLVQRTTQKTVNGWPGLAKMPLLKYFFSDNNTDLQQDEVLIVLTPHIVRVPDWTKENLKALYSGTDTNVQVRREAETKAPSQQPPAGAGAAPPSPKPPTTPNEPEPGSVAAATARVRFEPQTATLKVGQTMTLGVVVENVSDLFSIPLLLQYNPAVISVEEVEHGTFLSEGKQEIAIVQRVDKERGQAIISATRQPNTSGVNGSGTLMGIIIKALAPGSSNLSIVQVNAKNSQQKPIPLVTSEATLQVQQ